MLDIVRQAVEAARTAGADYAPVAQTLTFGAGETFKDVPVTILPDVLVEGSETLRLRLASPAGGNDCGERMFQHRANVLSQRLDIDRQIGAKRRDRKSDDASQRFA